MTVLCPTLTAKVKPSLIHVAEIEGQLSFGGLQKPSVQVLESFASLTRTGGAVNQHHCTMAAAAAAAASPLLTYWDRTPPYAAIALAEAANVSLSHAADPKGTKETITKLQFPSGYVVG